MRKILNLVLVVTAIFLVFATTFNYFYSWSGLASNQCVTFGDALDAVNTGVFTAKTTITASTQTMTKTDANTYLNINTLFTSYAAKASNQNINKQDLQAAFQYSGTLYYVNFDVGHNQAYGGWSSSGLACALGSPLSTTVYWNGTLTNGTVLYIPAGVFISAANTTDYFYIAGYSFTSSTSGWEIPFTVANYTACAGTYSGTLYVENTSGNTINGFTGLFSYSGSGVQTAITAAHFLTSTTLNGSVNGIVGANMIEIQNTSSQAMTVTGVVDYVTNSAISYSTSGNGTSDVQITLSGVTSANISNGIKVIFN